MRLFTRCSSVKIFSKLKWYFVLNLCRTWAYYSLALAQDAPEVLVCAIISVPTHYRWIGAMTCNEKVSWQAILNEKAKRI